MRDPWRWDDSARRTIFAHLTATTVQNVWLLLQVAKRPYGLSELFTMHRIVRDTFGGGLDDPQHMTEVLVRHTERVRARLHTERLLIYNVAQGWEPLCDFLGVEVPEVPFPHVDEGDQFQRLFGEHLGRRHCARATAGTAVAMLTALASCPPCAEPRSALLR